MPKKEPGLTLDELENIDTSYVIRLKGGKRYPFTKALISVMWRYGVESIETEMIEHDPTAQRAAQSRCRIVECYRTTSGSAKHGRSAGRCVGI